MRLKTFLLTFRSISRSLFIKTCHHPKWWYFIVYVCFICFYCEYFVYYLVLWRCAWPPDSGTLVRGETKGGNSNAPLHVLLLADPHLLGPRKGHWLDKLRREWQMYRSFQTANSLFNPQVVFILGDLFDEGQWSRTEGLDEYLDRFQSIFQVSSHQKLYVVLGNHDVGFHYAIDPGRMHWFKSAFNVEPVEMLEIQGNIFVLLNSMAMEGDGCFLCGGAERQLRQINQSLNCAKHPSTCGTNTRLSVPYSRPILLQHFPLFRHSDRHCAEPDGMPAPEKYELFREKWECLSKESTNQLLDWLHPRAVFGGHSHFGCKTYNSEFGFWEFTLASFSWRNNRNPAFMLLTVAPDSATVYKCLMPSEMTVFVVYAVSAVVLILWLSFTKCPKLRSKYSR